MNLFLFEEIKPSEYSKCTCHLSQAPSVVLEHFLLANIQNEVPIISSVLSFHKHRTK